MGSSPTTHIEVTGLLKVIYYLILSLQLTFSTVNEANKCVELPVQFISQLPDFPTGCEVVSLTMVLNYHGIDADVADIVDNYLPKGKLGKTNPEEAFIGSPRKISGYGIFSKGLAKTCELYTSSVEAIDITGCTLNEIEYFIRQGYPVIIWVSQDWSLKEKCNTIKYEGGSYNWYSGNHCVVISGFDDKNYIIQDPLVGTVKVLKETVKQVFNDRGSKALLIE